MDTATKMKLARKTNMITVVRSSICTEFNSQTIGTKVLDAYEFGYALHRAVDKHDWGGEENGQAVISLDDEFWSPSEMVVSAGVGRVSDNPDDYVLRKYRGQVRKYLRRDRAEPVTGCRAVVYTEKAYLEDPDITPEEETRILESPADFVLITVLADAGPDESPLTPGRLVRNLAGGNAAVDGWTKEDIIEKAHEAVDYYDDWHVVAD